MKGIDDAPAILVEIPEWWHAFAADFDLVGWTRAPVPFMPYRYVRTREPRNGALMVIASGTTELDGRRWAHVSFSRPRRMPSYDDLALVKERFIGVERKAISVHPPRSEHVSIHAYCLHLWCCLDGDGLPDFRTMGMI
jgi:hypothetical protein